MSPASTLPDDLAPEQLIRELKSSARKANHDEVARLLAECESRWGRSAAYAEALSWAARAYFSKGHHQHAASSAEDAYALSEDLRLKGAGADAAAERASLAIATGAAIEVQAQIAAEDGRHADAASYLRDMLERHQGQDFATRVRKNLHQLTLAGQPALPLDWTSLPGNTPLENPVGKRPVVLFFWAHWCSDSRAQGRTLSRLFDTGRFAEIALVAPTRTFGYITKGSDADAESETAHIASVLDADYPWMRTIPHACVLFGPDNCQRYGASTFPTLVLIDQNGIVQGYHSGVLKLEGLEPMLQSLVS